MDNDLRFFTNEPDRTLYERFSNILRSCTQYFDVLVGYFRTSGFFRMQDALVDVEKIRVLVGLNVDRQTLNIIDKASGEAALVPISTKNAKEAFAQEIEDEFEQSPTNANVEKGVTVFIEWLKSGKLEMRMYTEAPIHAKIYIMRKDQEKIRDQYGSVITGSSNFSESGLRNNLEFNVELKDRPDVDFALTKFEELWAKGVPISDAYIAAIENRTWLRGDITPYEIYLKTLYEFFKEEINDDKDSAVDALLPHGFMRLQYQIDAVTQAKKIMDAYGGVFIADVVGLGKTYICAMLAKKLTDGQKLVICPPVLKDYWERTLRQFDVAAKVESLGKLERIIENENLDDYKYVFVDEAHRFRNEDTEGFEMLKNICFGKKVILISATPINNYSNDIENQIYLFMPKRNSFIAGAKDLKGFFAGLRSKEGKHKKGSPEYIRQVRENSETIRDRVLRHILIRRTRKEIAEVYADDLAKQGLTFPKLGTPEQIIYEFDSATDQLFTDTVGIIKNFKYARYKPLTYLLDQTGYETMLAAQENMGGFMKGILVKRLESSFYAFKRTLSRFAESYRKFIGMFETGEVWISKKVDVYDMLDRGEDEELMSMVEDDRVMHFKSSDFDDKFINHLTNDLSRLEYLEKQWSLVTDDPKLEQFRHDLETDPKLKGKKKIIFTESKETAEYLERSLKDMYGDRVISFSGESSSFLKSEIEDSFNPSRPNDDKHPDKFDVLITTDALAEGINLHRSNVIVNYDLPWNPTRVMQRVGRINRVGTSFDEIFVFNFFPTTQSSVHLPLKERILEKIQVFHDTLGEDFKYLSDEEEVSPQSLFDRMNANLSGEEEDTASSELRYLNLIRQIRDKDKELYEKIKALPKKAKAGRSSPLIQEPTTLSFIRKGALKTFFITGDTASAEQLSFIDAIKYLECEPDEQKIMVESGYFDHFDENSEAFDYVLKAEEAEKPSARSVSPNDRKMIQYLKVIQKSKDFTDEQEAKIRRMLKLWEDGDISTRETKKILKALTGKSDPVEIFFVISNALPDRYFTERHAGTLAKNDRKTVILSEYMRGEQNV